LVPAPNESTMALSPWAEESPGSKAPDTRIPKNKIRAFL
jgi:hypothetical protein